MEDWQVVTHFIRRITEFPIVKAIIGIFIWLLHLFWGESFRPVYGGVMLLWVVDTITGLYYARLNPEIKPESRRMYHGLVKLMIYFALLAIGHQLSLIAITLFVQGIIEGFIVLTEGYSVLENLQKIGQLHQWKILPQIEQVMMILQGNISSIKTIPGVNPWGTNPQQPSKKGKPAQSPVNLPPEGDA